MEGDLEGGRGPGPDIPEERTPLKAIQTITLIEGIVGGTAGVAVITSIASMIVVNGYLVTPAGIMGCLVGPFAWYQETQLTDVKALKEAHEAFQRELEMLRESNNRLHAGVADLHATVDRLDGVEEGLAVITKQQGQNIEVFAEQLEENKRTLARMQENLKSTVMLNIMTVVREADVDRDGDLEGPEIDKLITRLKNLEHVTLNEDKFRDAIAGSGGSIRAVMKVFKNLLSDDDGDAIFELG
mmetsp:Transcript_11845/g.14778  ORF Transcript_11845/g.14778 Transcript_11845/m.14778 type:complete len:242 (-) Transcript_11845:158-883(-)|eukprot:CAMPEP_0172496064 /NCGR_PEP_ID=MMETSP1066-20121228/81073_1 /TAXON_ID=671091 /ORGANISM="Coscinodiscus wailesii, Strain CCMP2513" /LENGTH=241 /DNA_ID=CAMNT_0013268153 /DNA_START=69 /DNA_END=794 /DNA_ORIENTATION=+